ncbi:DUF7266 family protein [Halobacterium bonnevillei]|uniref:Uncharacterized protein n=1 Tax=Halobacterium bonnevillei TaxID=2692200 RepID=A0A6B0SFN1_9EURY|nr:hypothetical protein [Halobacterium bonnevillei]MXR20388.1 hypothetical protein [Halobacterium bonnevillei]
MADVGGRRGGGERRLREDDRGVSTTLGYVLNLGVAAILVTTLLLAAGTMVDDQRDRAVDTELRVVSERVAADLAAADRLARASDGGTVRYQIRAPRTVTGTTYDVRVNESGTDTVVLVGDRSGVSVSVEFHADLRVNATTEGSGDLVVVYDSDTGTLEVEDA